MNREIPGFYFGACLFSHSLTRSHAERSIFIVFFWGFICFKLERDRGAIKLLSLSSISFFLSFQIYLSRYTTSRVGFIIYQLLLASSSLISAYMHKTPKRTDISKFKRTTRFLNPQRLIAATNAMVAAEYPVRRREGFIPVMK